MKMPKGNEFVERQQSAAKAKKAMLEKFKAAPKMDDPELVAKRLEKAALAEAKAERQRAARAEKAELARLAKEAAAQEAADKAAASKPKERTEAERKAERDRRYAARKARK